MSATAVLDALRSGGPMDGTALIAATGLSRPTVHEVCKDLIDRGLIRELDSVRPRTRPGRRARRYGFEARAGHVLGIEVGLDRVRAVLADLHGDPLARVVRAVTDEDRAVGLRRAIRSVLASVAVEAAQVLAVTVGVPTRVDGKGRPDSADAVRLGLPEPDGLGELVGLTFGGPVVVENDAILAAVGERWRGVGRSVDDLVVILAGGRLRCGLVLGGRQVRGHTGGAGETGFLPLVDTPDEVMATSLAGATVGGASRGPGAGMAEEVERAAQQLARTVAVVAGVLDPELVVVVGGHLPTDLVVERVRRRELPRLMASPPSVVTSSLGEEAVAVGAVRLGLDVVEASVLADLGG